VKGSTSNVDGTTSWCQGAGPTFGVTVANGSVAYGAGPQYDLATGLGSVNVTNLLGKWSTFVRTGTTTTVTNPTGGTPSGTNFTATVTVTPAGVTGDVSLKALANDQTTVLASFGPFTLAGGTKSVTTNLLPPGTAFVSATYGGDATHGLSTSTPVALAGPVQGANFASKTTVNFVTFDNNGNPHLSITPSPVQYGSPYVLNVVVTKSDGTSCGFFYPKTVSPIPCPTGTVAMKDGANNLNDFPSGPASNATNIAKISNQGGLVEDFNVQLPGGNHSITAAFVSGDANYLNSSNNPALSVTITPAATTTLVASSLGVIPAGSTVTLTAVVGSASNSSQGPTGTIQFVSGTTNIGSPVTCNPTGATANGGASCSAQLPNAAISALFPPPTEGPRPTLPLLPALFALASILLLALGWKWMPEKRRRTYAYASLLAFALLTAVIAGCGGGGGGGGGGHNVTIKANYVGDTNYAASSGSTNVTVR
jgi:hypothetical protein